MNDFISLLVLGLLASSFGSSREDYRARARRDRSSWRVALKNAVSPINDYGTCFACDGTGTRSFECRNCAGSGTYTGSCHACAGSGRYTLAEKTCYRCSGSGHHKGQPCSRCKGSGVFQPQRVVACRRCAGTGIYRAECRRCDGSGELEVDCGKCGGTGWYRF